ncbi:MAG TPA: TrkH family potassium uptake protein [Clostridia bacterium]|nr:TrkH family potassium uptake protein [Clostridia bacterium]
MNQRFVIRTLGMLLLAESAAMMLPLLIAFYYGENAGMFLIPIIVTLVVGAFFLRLKLESTHVGHKEGFLVATFGWLSMALFGSLPFMLGGILPVDAFFETMSGFTTTGASVLPDVESLPRSILFWRSLTHWMGGIGFIVLTLALIPSLKIAGFQLFSTEVTGPTKSKVLPRIAEAARQLYKLYIGITIAALLSLKLAGLTWFDSFNHAFSTVATGGFSTYNKGIAAFNSITVESIIVFFMIISGISFMLHFKVIRGDVRAYSRDGEFKAYIGIILFAAILISANLFKVGGLEAGQAVRQSLFQVVSILTGTGFAIVDYDLWPDFSRTLLIILMFIGGCAGSTSGGVKVIRHVILIKAAFRQLVKLVHPQAVVPLRVGGKIISEETAETVHSFIILYLLTFAAGTALMAMLGYDLATAFSSVAVTIGSIGPGLGLVGPASTYAGLLPAAKILLSFMMLVGRLEIYSVFALLSTRFWR